MVQGRKQWEKKLFDDIQGLDNPIVWFHCASLGEFEQGRPLLESFIQLYPRHKVLLTFYSPSGYEIRKNYQHAHAVHYLPWDTAGNARKFYDLVKPAAAFLIKYEFWYHFIHEARNQGVPLMVCSAIFNEKQVFFRPYGALFRSMLGDTEHLFVQDLRSSQLLTGIGITSVTVAGDTRVDRVASIIRETKTIPIIEQFARGSALFIVGSSWPPDLEVLQELIDKEQHLKFVIAPHEVGEKQLELIESKFKRTSVRYSDFDRSKEAELLIIDTIGILSHLYRYGKYAYIGGAFGKGLHNILEPATFGLPLFFGNDNYQQFAEAEALVSLGGAFAIGNGKELYHAYSKLENDEASYRSASSVCTEYIQENTGATRKILHYVKDELQLK
jgi:3-deoxy-D-manno-octulosonic-acid transferase